MRIKSILVSCSLFANAYAGGMGPVSSDVNANITPLVIAEGAYSWNSMYPGQINGIQSTRNSSHWGGRVAGGFALQRTDNIRFSGEVGWGSYGHNVFPVTDGETASYYFYGFDMLLGTIYSYQKLDFFAKVGAMNENLQATVNTNLSKFYSGGLYSGHEGRSFTNSAILPEIKIGGEYNFYNNLALSLAYMYVFGSNQSIISNNVASPSAISINQEFRGQAPTFNSLMLGLRYYI